jgi:hypothetical protein
VARAQGRGHQPRAPSRTSSPRPAGSTPPASSS